MNTQSQHQLQSSDRSRKSRVRTSRPDRIPSGKKNFVLDTNVILHDPDSIMHFEDNDIYIPIVVLEELDHFKQGAEQINYNARKFIRHLDDLSGDTFFTQGASLGEGRGRLYVYIPRAYNSVVAKAFGRDIPDHRILSVALDLCDNQRDETTILVTKDVNLRMKAKSLGLDVEDYFNDKVEAKELFANSQRVYSDQPEELINALYASNEDGIPVEELSMSGELIANESFVLQNGASSVLARYNPFTGMVQRVDKKSYMGITARNAEQAFALDLLTDRNVPLIALSGKAGTGKTLLALAAALSQSDEYAQILLARPIVALANKDLGALPGSMEEKVRPYMQPLFDNLNVIKGQLKGRSHELQEIEQLQREGRLIIEALAYVRGRSLADSIVIIDEAQNLTPHEVKTIITRAAEGTKMIFTGDIEQIDSPYLDAESNGLAYMIDKMRGEKLFAHVNLVKGERSALSELASHKL